MSDEPCNSYSTLFICFEVDLSTFSKPEILIRLSTIASQFVESESCSRITRYHFTQSILGDAKDRSCHRLFHIGETHSQEYCARDELIDRPARNFSRHA